MFGVGIGDQIRTRELRSDYPCLVKGFHIVNFSSTHAEFRAQESFIQKFARLPLENSQVVTSEIISASKDSREAIRSNEYVFEWVNLSLHYTSRADKLFHLWGCERDIIGKFIVSFYLFNVSVSRLSIHTVLSSYPVR